ncbi:MAG: hypothetical protein WC758_01545 [Candidatus Woesearchaeota archaeon]|jgi:hypothetical protein
MKIKTSNEMKKTILTIDDCGFNRTNQIYTGKLSVDFNTKDWREKGLDFQFYKIQILQSVKYVQNSEQNNIFIFPKLIAYGTPNNSTSGHDFIKLEFIPDIEKILNSQNTDANLFASIELLRHNMYFKGEGTSDSRHFPIILDVIQTNQDKYKKSNNFIVTGKFKNQQEIPVLMDYKY